MDALLSHKNEQIKKTHLRNKDIQPSCSKVEIKDNTYMWIIVRKANQEPSQPTNQPIIICYSIDGAKYFFLKP